MFVFCLLLVLASIQMLAQEKIVILSPDLSFLKSSESLNAVPCPRPPPRLDRVSRTSIIERLASRHQQLHTLGREGGGGGRGGGKGGDRGKEGKRENSGRDGKGGNRGREGRRRRSG